MSDQSKELVTEKADFLKISAVENGKFILKKSKISDESFSKFDTKQKENLLIALSEGLVSIKIVKNFLQGKINNSQFEAMVTDEGLSMLRSGMFTPQDFNNSKINEIIPFEILIKIKKIKMEDFYVLQGKDVLTKHKVKNKHLKKIGISKPDQIRNLEMAIGEKLISIAIVQDFLENRRDWSGNQLAAMVTERGLNALRQHELAPKDFRNKYVADDLSPDQAFDQIYQLKWIELSFYKSSSDDFGTSVQDGKWHFRQETSSIIPKESELPKKHIFDEKIGLKSDNIVVPEVDRDIAKAALYYAKKYRKKGGTELENNDRSANEFKFINFYVGQNRAYVKAAYLERIEKLVQQGYVNQKNIKQLTAGAWMHYMIEAAKSGFMGNCAEMAILTLDYLDQIGYDKPVFYAGVNGGDHAVIVVYGKDGSQQIWDSWANKAYIWSQKNLQLHLQVFRQGYASNGGAAHKLEPYNPSKHAIDVYENHSLESLRLFRRISALAYQQENSPAQVSSPSTTGVIKEVKVARHLDKMDPVKPTSGGTSSSYAQLFSTQLKPGEVPAISSIAYKDSQSLGQALGMPESSVQKLPSQPETSTIARTIPGSSTPGTNFPLG